MFILAAANSEAYEIGYKIGAVFGAVFMSCLLFVVPALFIIFLVLAIRKKTGGWITAAIITGIFSLVPVGLVIFGAAKVISRHAAANQDISARSEIVSSDKTCKLTIPGHWKALEKLSQTAIIKAGNPSQEEYLMVLIEPKENFDEKMTLKEYADRVTDKVIDSLDDGSKEQVKEFEINGLKAIEYKIYGTSKHVKLIYIHTTVEGKNRYYRIVGWTLPSNADSALETIRQTAATFVEL